VVQVPKFNIGGFGFVMDSKGAFWNDMFEKKLLKLKDHLDAIFYVTLLKQSMITLLLANVYSFVELPY